LGVLCGVVFVSVLDVIGVLYDVVVWYVLVLIFVLVCDIDIGGVVMVYGLDFVVVVIMV